MMDKSIIIATFRHDNYGTCLQNYALVYTLRKLGVNPITYAPNIHKEDIIILCKRLLGRLPLVSHKQRRWVGERLKHIAFHEFKLKLNIVKISLSKRNTECINMKAIAGSDQIWAPKLMTQFPILADFYFLRFVSQKYRFSYAPSFGTANIPINLFERYREYINGINLLSVRECSGQKIVKDITGRDAALVPDPTFLLDINEWRKIAVEPLENIPKGEYILTYFLSEQDASLWNSIQDYANQSNLQVIRIAGNWYKQKEIVPAPDEFVWLIDHASVLFTDSFHGAAFAILMKTRFLVYRRTDVDQFTRVENLLEKTKFKNTLANAMHGSMFCEVLKNEDFKDSTQIIDEERKVGLGFLKQVLEA